MPRTPPVSVEKIDVHYVARLARIELTEDEAKAFGGQIQNIVAHVQQLDKADISQVNDTSHISDDSSNHLREDVPGTCLPTDKVLQNAPESAEGEIVMPKIVND